MNAGFKLAGVLGLVCAVPITPFWFLLHHPRISAILVNSIAMTAIRHRDETSSFLTMLNVGLLTQGTVVLIQDRIGNKGRLISLALGCSVMLPSTLHPCLNLLHERFAPQTKSLVLSISIALGVHTE